MLSPKRGRYCLPHNKKYRKIFINCLNAIHSKSEHHCETSTQISLIPPFCCVPQKSICLIFVVPLNENRFALEGTMSIIEDKNGWINPEGRGFCVWDFQLEFGKRGRDFPSSPKILINVAVDTWDIVLRSS